MDGDKFAGIKVVEKRIKKVQKGLRPSQGRAEIRNTSAKWAWIEYMLAQGCPQMGEAVVFAVQEGGSFAHYKNIHKKSR